MSRAGLLSLVVFALIGVVVCIPIPERLSGLVERSDYSSDLATRALDIFEDPVYFKRDYLPELEVRDLDLDFNQYFGREYDLDMFDERDFDDLEHDFARRDMQVLEKRNFLKKLFHKIGHAFKKVGQKIGHAFKKVGQGIAHIAKKAVHGIVHVAKKVGHFIRTTGAKIVKFGLKIVAAAAAVAEKAFKFIPGLGTAAGMVAKGIAIGANKASDKIRANLGKLGKVSKALNNVINPFGSAAKHMGKGGKVLGALF